MQDHDSHKKNISNLLLAADTSSKENPLQTAVHFLKIVRKRWMILSASFALIVAVFFVKHFTAKEKFYASAELIAISDQFTSSDVLNHPLLKLGPELIVSDEVIEAAAARVSLKEADGITKVKSEDEVEFLLKNFAVSATRSKPHVIHITFYDQDEDQAKDCLNAIIVSYQEYAQKSMEEWKQKKIKLQQERIKFYEESDKEVAFGSKLIEQAEAMSNSLNSIKGEFDSENPLHREQLSHSLQEQIYGMHPDLGNKETRSEKIADGTSPTTPIEESQKIDNKSGSNQNSPELNPGKKDQDPLNQKLVDGSSGKPVPAVEPETVPGESPLPNKSPNLVSGHSINKTTTKMDGFEKELAQLQLLLYQSRILNQLRSTVVRIEQKARSRQNLASELEIPIHVKVNKKTKSQVLGESQSAKRMILVVCFLATGLGIGLIFVMDQFDDHFRSPVEAEKILVKPVLGIIPAMENSGNENQTSYQRKESFFVTKVFMENHGIGKGITGITSGSRLENSSEISYDLAKIYAQSGEKTLLIDANFRDGKLTDTLNHTLGIGLSDLLQQPEASEEAIKRLVCSTDEDNLFFISQGTKSSTPLLLFDQKRLQTILNWAKENYDLVILDLPSATEFNDSKVIGRYCKRVLFVISPELTTRLATRRAMVAMESFGCHIAGTIFIDRGKSQVWDSAETPDSPLFNINQILVSSIGNQNDQPDHESDSNDDTSKTIRVA
jgi:protein-tyrosine kinase